MTFTALTHTPAFSLFPSLAIGNSMQFNRSQIPRRGFGAVVIGVPISNSLSYSHAGGEGLGKDLLTS